MHRCLSIEELLNLVCEELDGFDALPKLARTAKVFQEPALNTLWRRQESMDPLFSALPSDMFIRNPREQWDVTRIKDVTVGTSDNQLGLGGRECYTAVRHAFELFYPNESYLPSPLILTTSLDNEEGWIMNDFVSTNLRSLTIYRASHPSMLTMLAGLSIRAPMLTNLGVLCFTSDDVQSPLSESLPALQHLRSFTCIASITDEALATLSGLPNLCRILFHLPKHPLSVAIPQQSSQPYFQSINSAAVTTNRLHATTQFVKSWMVTSPICEFQAFITGRDEVWSDSPHIPLVALVAERYFDNLTSFVLTSEERFPSINSTHSNSLSSQDFHPLLLCKKIEIFKIYLPCSLANFDDESLKKMANAWPGLRKITLLPYSQQQPSLCSFQSLVHLSRGCPKLESVSITFSLGQDSSFSIDGGVPNVMGLGLTELHDGLSPLEQTSAPAVASFLRSLAPNLRNVSKEGRYVRVGFYTIEEVNFWAEVNELLNV
ncbi:hypothetical protein HWV62_45142 [Athelia sp. TMB]|nr:hypothetical protein HWV62_45142 [Athelia sp. TMB]